MSSPPLNFGLGHMTSLGWWSMDRNEWVPLLSSGLERSQTHQIFLLCSVKTFSVSASHWVWALEWTHVEQRWAKPQGRPKLGAETLSQAQPGSANPRWPGDPLKHEWKCVIIATFLFPPSIFPSIRVFCNESVLHQVAKWRTQLQHQSFQGIFRTDFL